MNLQQSGVCLSKRQFDRLRHQIDHVLLCLGRFWFHSEYHLQLVGQCRRCNGVNTVLFYYLGCLRLQYVGCQFYNVVGLALTRFQSWVFLVNDVSFAFSDDDLAIFRSSFNTTFYFHCFSLLSSEVLISVYMLFDPLSNRTG